LIRRQLTERGRQRFPESAFVGVISRSERGVLGSKLFVMFAASATAAQQIDRGIVSQPQQKRPTISHTTKQSRLSGKFDEYLLENVARVVFVPRGIEHEDEQCLCVFVIKPLYINAGRHAFSALMTRPAAFFVYG
jgi:hypothetical protein